MKTSACDMASPLSRQWRATARAQHWREGSPRNEDNARMATADHDRQGQTAHRQYKSCI